VGEENEGAPGSTDVDWKRKKERKNKVEGEEGEEGELRSKGHARPGAYNILGDQADNGVVPWW
jgi:hypothetical protein